MPKFKCEIDMSNSSFQENGSLELVLIVEKMLDQWHINGLTQGKCYDSTGNNVGFWRIR